MGCLKRRAGLPAPKEKKQRETFRDTGLLYKWHRNDFCHVFIVRGPLTQFELAKNNALSYFYRSQSSTPMISFAA